MKTSLLALLTAFLCSTVSLFADQKDGKPEIYGVPSQVTADKRGGSLFVDGEKGFAYDKAKIRITEKTVIQKQNGKLVEAATIDDLKKAGKVSVWFTGNVAESYPVQATAGKILIFPKADKQDKE